LAGPSYAWPDDRFLVKLVVVLGPPFVVFVVVSVLTALSAQRVRLSRRWIVWVIGLVVGLILSVLTMFAVMLEMTRPILT
jgi:hypothetical protein